MGVVYHAHFLDYFEAARTEALRSLGLPYAELEASGIHMPVTDLALRFRRPARYDDLLVVRTVFLDSRPLASVTVEYEVFRESEPTVILVTGHVRLCFVDSASGRPVRAPKRVLDVFSSVARTAE